MTTTQKTTDVTAPRRSHWWWTVPGCLAMVLLNAAVSYGIVRLNAPVTAAFNMKQTVDARQSETTVRSTVKSPFSAF